MKWHKLNEEPPNKKGLYLTYDPSYPEEQSRYSLELWHSWEGVFAFWDLDDDDNPTHWAELEKP